METRSNPTARHPDRERKAGEYYLEEPLVKNRVNPVSVKVKYA